MFGTSVYTAILIAKNAIVHSLTMLSTVHTPIDNW